MVTIFWDSKRIFLIDYLAKRQTKNETYYAASLDEMKVVISEERLAIARQRLLFHHGDAPSHTSDVSLSPYSPDLPPIQTFIYSHNLSYFLPKKKLI